MGLSLSKRQSFSAHSQHGVHHMGVQKKAQEDGVCSLSSAPTMVSVSLAASNPIPASARAKAVVSSAAMAVPFDDEEAGVQGEAAVDAAVLRALAYVPVLSQGRFKVNEPVESLCIRLSAHITALAIKYNPTSFEEAAEYDAAGFEWPSEVFERDANSVRAEGSLKGAIAAKRQACLPGRFNVERVTAMFREDPDYLTLMDLAEHGARIELSPDVVLDRVPPPMRAKQLRMPLTVQKHAFKLWKKGRGMIMRYEDIPEAERHLVAFHHSHWTKKVDDDPAKAAPGRWLMDCKSINDDFTKAAAIKRYGRVVYPTISSILAKWLKYATDLGVQLADCRISKDDVESAFAQFDFAPESAMLLGVRVSEELVFFHITGMFGWTGCPMVFACPVRAIARWIDARSETPNDVFADDFVDLALTIKASAKQALVGCGINGTFPKGVSLGKQCTPALRQFVLGWDVDLVTELVNPTVAGCEKLLLYFFLFDTSLSHTLVEWQRLASIAEHWSTGVVGMRWTVSALNKGKCECEASKKGRIRVRPDAKFSVEMWRVVAIILFLNPQAMAVPITHIARNDPLFPLALRRGGWLFDLISDASYWKICVALRDHTGKVLTWTVIDLPWVKSAFQNVREYMGLLLGLILLNLTLIENGEKGGRHDQHVVRWTGDNRTALRWAETSKVKSKSGQLANLAVVWGQLYGNFEIVETVFLEGARMGEIDDATRDRELSQLSPELFRDVGAIPGVLELFALCDPAINQCTIDHHKAFCLVHAHLAAIFN